MPRHAQLGKKNGYWHTKAGGEDTYFGRVGEVTYKDAKKAFGEHLKSIGARTGSRAGGVSTARLVDLFLDWIQAHRSDRTYDERRRHLERFINFTAPGGSRLIGELAATAVRAEDLAAFLSHVAAPEVGKDKDGKKLDPFTVGKHATSVRACFAWGAGKNNPSPCLPRDFHPFAGMERYKRPPEPLLEGELPTADEIAALLRHAEDDLGLLVEKGKYRARRPDEFRPDNPYVGFRHMLVVYHQTGARTSELAKAKAGHLVRDSRQIVLSDHKRAKTTREAAARRITLPDESFAIVEKLCTGRKADEPIFTDPKGRPWTRDRLDNRLEHVRRRAGVRNEITIYSLRHLWISEALMAGINPATVAKMAGTSIAMIEKVYGHFRADHMREAAAQLQEARRVSAAKAATPSAA